MKPIAFVGLKQSGKSTACAYLESKLLSSARVNFKDALVQEIKDGFPDLLREMADHYGMTIDDLFKEKPPLMRALMQNFGTEVRRTQDPEYWVKQWKETAVKEMEKGKTVLCDDVRFWEEINAINALGGVTIKIVRDDIVPTDTHQSETEHLAFTCDYVVNTKKGDLDGFYKELSKIVI